MFAFAGEQKRLEWVEPLQKVKYLKIIPQQVKWLLALGVALAVVASGLRAVEQTPVAAAETAKTTTATTLAPGLDDGRIAYVTARVLSQYHYSHHPLDDEYSSRFFDRYLETLDPQRLHFTQADVAEFEHYRDRLDNLTITQSGVGDVTPAFKIFSRFRQRLEERVAFAEAELKAGKFDFSTDERMIVSRKEAAYPKDLAEAKALWKQRLRYEYLQEKLAKAGAKKKGGTPVGSFKIKDFNVGKVGKFIPNDQRTNSALAEEIKSTPLSLTNLPAENPAPIAQVEKKASSPAKEVKKKTDAEDIVETLTRRYTRNLRFFKDWDNEDVRQIYLDALAHVYDPHSDYMNPAQADNFAIGMNNALIGIGAVLTTDQDGFCKIQELKPGPATNSKKIKPGDRIVAVAQSNAPPVDAIEMALNKVVRMIRGQKGTEVRLTVQPAEGDASDRFVLSLIREEIKIEEQAAKGKIIESPGEPGAPLRLGVIELPSFYAPLNVDGRGPMIAATSGAGAYGHYTSVDVAALLKKFQTNKVSGVILDLRRNGGGSLEEAVKLTGLFIKEGPVVQVRDSDGSVFVQEDHDAKQLYAGPLIVLTSRFSASASEIFAAALQDYNRAVIVGDQSTHGKGTVQRIFGLDRWMPLDTRATTNDPGEIKITMSKFYRASGASTQKRGVLPDIVLPSVFSYSKDLGEAAAENALEAGDPIPSAKCDKLNQVATYLGELLKRSSARLATNVDYGYIREDIDQFRKNQEDKSVSLNEPKRLREKDEADARTKARDKERRARAETKEKIYELTLKLVDLPGLPAAVQKTNATVAKATGVSAAGGDNTVSVTPAKPRATDGATDLDEEEEKAPAVDATLEEAEHILTDYITLLSQKGFATTSPGSNSN